MDSPVIEQGIPMPNYGPSRSRWCDLFQSMEVGDSTFILGQSVCGQAYKAAKNLQYSTGWVFKGRTLDGGVRIWRVA